MEAFQDFGEGEDGDGHSAELGLAFLLGFRLEVGVVDRDDGYESGLDVVFESDIDAWGDADVTAGFDELGGIGDFGNVEQVQADEVFLSLVGFDESNGQVFGTVGGTNHDFRRGVGDIAFSELGVRGEGFLHLGFCLYPVRVGNERSPGEGAGAIRAVDDVLEGVLELFPGEVGVEGEEGAEGAQEVFGVASAAFDSGEADSDLLFKLGLVEGLDVVANDE
jgi:hypothetical protein